MEGYIYIYIFGLSETGLSREKSRVNLERLGQFQSHDRGMNDFFYLERSLVDSHSIWLGWWSGAGAR